MGELRTQVGVTPRALEFTILTAARTNEALGAKWPEINFFDKVWTVPAERMKAGKEHRVPLSARAIEILQELAAIKTNELVFPGLKPRRHLSNMALLMLLRRMKRDEITVDERRMIFYLLTGQVDDLGKYDGSSTYQGYQCRFLNRPCLIRDPWKDDYSWIDEARREQISTVARP